MTYEDYINGIIKSRGRHGCIGYKESHHIVLRSCGGGNEASNLVDLYPEEHYTAHKILAIENPDNEQAVRAWNMMHHMRECNKPISKEEFALLRKHNAECRRADAKEKWSDPEWRENQIKRFSERASTPEAKAIHREALKKCWENESFREHAHAASVRNMTALNQNESIMVAARQKGERTNIEKYGKRVLCVETGAVYESIRDAARQTGVDRKSLSCVCRGKKKYKTAGGFHWAFVGEGVV